MHSRYIVAASSYHSGWHKSLEHFPHHRKFYWIAVVSNLEAVFHIACMLSFECVSYAPQIEHFRSRSNLCPKLPVPFTSCVSESPAPKSEVSEPALFRPWYPLSPQVHLGCLFSISRLSSSPGPPVLSSGPCYLSTGLCLWHPS